MTTDQSITASGRMHALDGLRATMMLLGLALHTTASYTARSLGSTWPYQDTTTTFFADRMLYFIHVFRMPIFFVLAGFFAAMIYCRRGDLGFARNRLGRIGIPFVVSLLLLYPLIVSGFTFANAAKVGGVNEAFIAVTELASTSTFFLPESTWHLWFIYYLLYFYLSILILVKLSRLVPETIRAQFMRSFRYVVSHPILRVILPACITFWTLFPMGGIILTGTSFVPNIWVFLAYAVFFVFGWILYGVQDVLRQFIQSAWVYLILAISAYFILALLIIPGINWSGQRFALLIIASSVNSMVVWMLFFGFTGIFLRYFDRPSVYIRYIVDASYWVYLVHLPCTIWIPGLLVNTDLSVWVKMLIVLATSTFIGFFTYYLFVRSTFIGQALNGKRYPRRLLSET